MPRPIKPPSGFFTPTSSHAGSSPARAPVGGYVPLPLRGSEDLCNIDKDPEDEIPPLSQSVDVIDLGSSPPTLEASPSPEASHSPLLYIDFPESALLTPVSCYEPFTPPAPETTETEYLSTLASLFGRDQKTVPLEQFAIYCNTDKYPLEMRSLDKSTCRKVKKLYFNAVVSCVKERFFLRRVPVEAVSVGLPNHPTTGNINGLIYIETMEGRRKRAIYTLGQPVKEYDRFLTPFLWVAQLSLYFVEFLAETTKPVSLELFRSEFLCWIRQTNDNENVERWLKLHPSSDFRTSIAANKELLARQAERFLKGD